MSPTAPAPRVPSEGITIDGINDINGTINGHRSRIDGAIDDFLINARHQWAINTIIDRFNNEGEGYEDCHPNVQVANSRACLSRCDINKHHDRESQCIITSSIPLSPDKLLAHERGRNVWTFPRSLPA